MDTKTDGRCMQMEEIKLRQNELLKVMKEIHTRKVMGTDEVAEWVLREYAEHLIGLLHGVIMFPI